MSETLYYGGKNIAGLSNVTASSFYGTFVGSASQLTGIPTGPTGPQGTTGPTGITGPTGFTGPGYGPYQTAAGTSISPIVGGSVIVTLLTNLQSAFFVNQTVRVAINTSTYFDGIITNIAGLNYTVQVDFTTTASATGQWTFGLSGQRGAIGWTGPTGPAPTGSAGGVVYLTASQLSAATLPADLFWNNSNGRLGVKQAAPAYTLDVTGNARITTDMTLGTALAISSGGTSSATQQGAINALAGSVTSGSFLRGDGTNVSMAVIQNSDLPATISRTTISGTLAGPLAGTNTISATTISGTTILGTSHVGPIVGSNTISASSVNSSGKIWGSEIYGIISGSNSITCTSIVGSQQVSGNPLVGPLTGSNTISATTISGTAISGTSLIGPIVGSNTISTTTVTATSVIGTLYGALSGANTIGCSSVTSTGAVSGTAILGTSHVGPIVGSNAIACSSVTSSGAVSGTAILGTSHVGPIVGSNAIACSSVTSSGVISGTAILGTSHVGAIVGSNTISGTSLTVSTAVSIANGGTGQTERQAALNALAGATTTARVLRGDGTNISLAQVTLSTDVTGTLPITNGGTGQTERQAALNALAGATTTARVLRGDGTNISLAQVTLSTDVTGVLPIANGGTGGSSSVAINNVFAGPSSGAAGAPLFRTLVSADIPTLNQNTTGSAGSLSGNPSTSVSPLYILAATSAPSWDGASETAQRTNTYIALNDGGSGSDWAYMRQIGTTNAYELALDFHDDGDDCRMSWRDVNSTLATDSVVTRMRLNAGSGLFVAGDVTAFNNFSDARLKEDVVNIDKCLDKIQELRPVEFTWKQDIRNKTKRGKRDVGMIAQEAVEVFPLAHKIVQDPDTKEDIHTLKYERFVPLLIGALKEEKAKREALELRLERLEKLLEYQ